jgi:hypothetical protein
MFIRSYDLAQRGSSPFSQTNTERPSQGAGFLVPKHDSLVACDRVTDKGS